MFAFFNNTDRLPPLYFTTLSSKHYQGSTVRKEGLKECSQILFVLKGAGTLYVKGAEYKLNEGCSFFLSPGIPHTYTNDGGLVTAWITFCGDAVSGLCSYADVKDFMLYEKTDIDKYLSRIIEMETEYLASRREGLLSSMLYSFVTAYFDEKKSKEATSVDVALRYLEDNFASRIALDDICRVCHLSKSGLAKKFKDKFGCTPFEKLIEIRILNAEQMLNIYPEEKVCVIAKKCGFDDIGYFYKAYKRCLSKTPRKRKS